MRLITSFIFKAQTLIRDLLEHAALYGEQLKNAAYPLYVFGRAAEGDFAALGILLLAVGIVFVLLWILLSRSFIHIATSSAVVSKIKYKERKVKCKSEFAALFGKEMKRFTSSPNYILNCGMGILLLIAPWLAILLKGNVVVSFITEVWGSAGQALVPVAFCAAVCLAAAMNDMAAPSVSLEGKNLWLVQSLPVSPLKVLKAKLSRAAGADRGTGAVLQRLYNTRLEAWFSRKRFIFRKRLHRDRFYGACRFSMWHKNAESDMDK